MADDNKYKYNDNSVKIKALTHTLTVLNAHKSNMVLYAETVLLCISTMVLAHAEQIAIRNHYFIRTMNS